MIYAGARGETAAERERALRFPYGDDRLHAAMDAHVRSLGGKTKEASGYELAVANRLWGQKGFPFLPEFLALTRDRYGAGL